MVKRIRIKRKKVPTVHTGGEENNSLTKKKKRKPIVLISIISVVLISAAFLCYRFILLKPNVSETMKQSLATGCICAFGIDKNVNDTLFITAQSGLYEGLDEIKYKAFGGKDNYNRLLDILVTNGRDVKGIISVDITASNNQSSALYGSVILFNANITYYDNSLSVQSFTSDTVTIENINGFTPVRSNALFVSGDAQSSCSVSFVSVSKTFSYTVKTQSTSYDNIDILVNKISRIDSSYLPGDLNDNGSVSYVYPIGDEVNNMRSEANEALGEMFAAAKSEGVTLYALSGYRSYETQQYLYDRAGGDNQNDTAAPGASEHQTGLCMDITWSAAGLGLSSDMQYDSEYDWLINNSYKYGFVLRYPDGWADITGYVYEPWHYRYIGRDLALAYHNSPKHTLEEFLSEY